MQLDLQLYSGYNANAGSTDEAELPEELEQLQHALLTSGEGESDARARVRELLTFEKAAFQHHFVFVLYL